MKVFYLDSQLTIKILKSRDRLFIIEENILYKIRKNFGIILLGKVVHMVGRQWILCGAIHSKVYEFLFLVQENSRYTCN